MTELVEKKTPLYETHIKLGAKMVEFGGWHMPVHYSGIIDEHNTVRNNVGLFDVSHMGQFFVSGKDVVTYLQKMLPQDISKLPLNKALYCQLPNYNGGLIDDLIVYRLEEANFLIILNASRIEIDVEWFRTNVANFDVILENKSDKYSMLALQGPLAYKVVEKFGIQESEQPPFFTINKNAIYDKTFYIARTGYTGEDGFEFIVENTDIEFFWAKILDYGAEFGIKPIGLGARDTLRLEAALMLYGNELNENITPIEAGLKWSIPQAKIADYNGKDKIKEQYKNGISKKLIGFEMIDRAIPRHEYEIYHNNKKIGEVTSGGFSPTLNKNIGMGYIDNTDEIGLDSIIQIMVRNKLYNAQIVKRPFVKKNYKQ